MIRAARGLPIASRLCRKLVDAWPVLMISIPASKNKSSKSSSLAALKFSSVSVISTALGKNAGLAWERQYLTRRATSFSLMKVPWIRIGLLLPMGSKSISPRPSNFSAPPVSRMVRLSIGELTVKAILDGILALIRPVMTSTEGLCVATTR
ncbi:hypothetical protein SDC9_200275 [bioreactor metagenome]|uniref:Uncharacterized protein n=1 Tax=bioreactor metagenome TaxID=1076179 RepID=A0A645IZI1_9ZZZZ